MGSENKIAVLVSCFGWFDKRLKHVKRVLTNQGYSVKIYTADFDHLEKKRILEKNEECNYIKVLEYKKNLSISRMLSHILFSKRIYNVLEDNNPDLIYALVPPNTVSRTCKKYVKRHIRTKLIFDIMDLWPETMPINSVKKLPGINLWANIRNKSLHYADYIITECDLYQEKLESYLNPQKTKTLYISREINSIGIEALSNESIKVCYLGSINNIIDIDLIVKIVEHLIKVANKKISLEIIGDGEKREQLIEKVKITGAVVNWHGKVFDPIKKNSIMSSCCFGLNIMKENVCVGLSLKSIDYFEAGLPIINNISSDTWKLVEKENIGYNINEFFRIKELDIKTINEMRHNVKKCFVKYFDIESFNRAILDIIKQIEG